MDDNIYKYALLILAVAQFITPMFYGWIFMSMFKYFPTRNEMNLIENNQAVRHEENKKRFERLEENMIAIIAQKVPHR